MIQSNYRPDLEFRNVLFTGSNKLADQLQNFALHAGYSADLAYNKQNVRPYQITINMVDSDLTVDVGNQKLVNFKGQVYCCTVPSV